MLPYVVPILRELTWLLQVFTHVKHLRELDKSVQLLLVVSVSENIRNIYNPTRALLYEMYITLR